MRAHYRDGGPSVDLYDHQHSDDRGTVFEGDVDFYMRQARRAGGPVLELGCGTGRVALPLARAGFDVTGIDLSPHMLRIARKKTEEAGLGDRLTWVQGSMERFRLRRRYRLVLVPFRAFQHLLTPRAQRRCLGCVRGHLTKGGRLILHLFDPRLEYCLLRGHTARMRRDGRIDPVTGRSFEVVIRDRRNDPFRQVFTESWLWTERDRRGRVVRRSHDRLTLRWTYREEMRYLLELAGFKVMALYSDFYGAPPAYGKEQIWIAR